MAISGVQSYIQGCLSLKLRGKGAVLQLHFLQDYCVHHKASSPQSSCVRGAVFTQTAVQTQPRLTTNLMSTHPPAAKPMKATSSCGSSLDKDARSPPPSSFTPTCMQIRWRRACEGLGSLTAGNDRGGLRDRFRPPEPEWLLSAIASSSSSVE